MAGKKKIGNSGYQKAMLASVAQSEGKIVGLQAEAANLLRNEIAPFLSGPGIKAGSNNGVFVENGDEFRRLAAEAFRINTEVSEEEGFLAQLKTRLEKHAAENQNGAEAPAEAETGEDATPPA